ncbi:hypothetical protein ACA910_007400 [Epithemia clementina (nom. ined.)]
MCLQLVISGDLGKFCLVDKTRCVIKSYKRAPMGWEQALHQGVKSALFIQSPGTGASAGVFLTPIFNADNISATCLQKLLSIRKPVALWGRIFVLLDAKSSTKDEEEIKDPYSNGMLFEHDELKVPLDEETLESEASTKRFVPKLESKLANTTNPAKFARVTGLGASIHSPPLMVLKDMGSDMSNTDFRLATSFNIEDLHNTQISLCQELFRSMSASQ